MGGVPDKDSLQELVEERDFDRRVVLVGAGLAGSGGWVLGDLTLSKAKSRLSDAEESAVTLADRLNETDLRDPLMMSGLTLMVERTIETIDEVLHDVVVTQGAQLANTQRQVTNTLSILPGVTSPPEQSRPEKRMGRLEAALRYYQSLNEVIQHAASIQRVLAMIETPALNDAERPEQSLSSIVDTEPIETSNEEARSVGEQATNEESAKSLLPEIEQVAGQLSTQIQIQTLFKEGIQAYLDTAELIETGARHHEQERLEQAKTQFHTANEAIPEDLLKSEQAYKISHTGPTLHDYAKHFSKRKRGLDQLIAACEPGADPSTQNARFNAGLSHLIDARGVINQ